MALLNYFSRCSRRNPCPVCGKPGWCLVGRSDSRCAGTAICKRVESKHRWKEAGYFHCLSGAAFEREAARTYTVPIRASNPRRFEELAERAQLAIGSDALVLASQRLGIAQVSLLRLGVGLVTEEITASIQCPWALGALTFPMRDAGAEVIGIRLRHPDARKTSVPGSRPGLFLPAGSETSQVLFLCEGPTDTAAVLDLGLTAVGRPDATGGQVDAVAMAVALAPTSVVVCADNDEVGLKGGRRLAAALVTQVPEVRLLTPPAPYKDMRDWIRAGADQATVLARVTALCPWSVTIRAIARPQPPKEAS